MSEINQQNLDWREGYRQGFEDARPELPRGVRVTINCPVCQRHFQLSTGESSDNSPNHLLVGFVQHFQSHDVGPSFWQCMIILDIPPQP
jgi:hypothetical protein